jgi:hypothetical protein
MSDRKWPSVAHEGSVVLFPRRPIGTASRIAAVVIVAIALIFIGRLIVVKYRNGVENAAEKRAEREEEITRWIDYNLGNAEAKVVSFGDYHEELFKNERSMEVMVGQLNKPAEEQFCVCRFTFDPSGRVLNVSQRPVR